MDRERRQDQRFDRDEAADIFDLAAALEQGDKERGEGLGLDDLHRIGDELGISSAAIDRAIRSIRKDGRREAKAGKKTARRRLRFIRHAMAYVTVIVILALLDAVAGGGWWFFWFAGLWGILLALHAMRFVTRRNGPIDRRLAADSDGG